MKGDKAEVQDPLLEVNFGIVVNPRLMFFSALLQEDTKKEFIKLLTSYKDYFAWDYHELPRLDRSWLSIAYPLRQILGPINNLQGAWHLMC